MMRDDLLTAYARGERDFRGADLAGADLSTACLSGADMREADLREASLSYLSAADLRGADLRGADLSMALLSGSDLREADLRAADLSGANLYEVRWGATRLHDSGTWSADPPRCAAGDWHAWVLAPGVVRIGCTTMSVAQWLADGPQLAADHGASPHDVNTLREWLLRLDTQTEWPGWVPETMGADHDA